jgi:hypothetical protein
MITASRENAYVAQLLNTILRESHLVFRPYSEPDRSTDYDAPALKKFGESGILIHGDNRLVEALRSLGGCFDVKFTKQTPQEVWDYLKVADDIQRVWIEIGDGSPWKNNINCTK